MRKKLFRGVIALLLVGSIASLPYIANQMSVAARVKQLFEQSYELGNLSPKIQQGIGAGNEPSATARLKTQLEATYVPTEARVHFDAIVKMYREENGQALDNRFDDVDFQILWWEGSAENDGVLVAKFTGIAKVTTNGQTRDASCLGQYEVNLHKATSGDQWLLSNWKLNEFSHCR